MTIASRPLIFRAHEENLPHSASPDTAAIKFTSELHTQSLRMTLRVASLASASGRVSHGVYT